MTTRERQKIKYDASLAHTYSPKTAHHQQRALPHPLNHGAGVAHPLLCDIRRSLSAGVWVPESNVREKSERKCESVS